MADSAHPQRVIRCAICFAADRRAAAELTGETSIAMLFRRLRETKAITINQIEGRLRGAGSEFALACDMSFAARETALFCQMERSFGVVPGGGAVQQLARLMGGKRALEVVFNADDYSAQVVVSRRRQPC